MFISCRVAAQHWMVNWYKYSMMSDSSHPACVQHGKPRMALPWEQISIASEQRGAKVSTRISVSRSPLPGILSEPALAGRALPDQNLIGPGPQKS